MDAGRAADLLAVLHLGYVLFVVVGQGLILCGWALAWTWTRNPWFRWLHLAAIGLVVAETVLGVYCPLTIIEARLRAAAGEIGYGESFVGYWVGRVLYHDVPLWQAHVVYLAFGALVLWTFVRYPPRRRRRASGAGRSAGRV